MKKKQRKFLKKNFIQLKNAFSLIEITISLLVISIIIAALTPTISKRLTASTASKNKLSTECNSVCSDGFCAYCYPARGICAIYTKQCAANQYKDVEHCKCINCTTHNENCTRCSSKGCTQCAAGYYLDDKNNCVKCPRGYYCFQDGNNSRKLPCPPGSVAGSEGMSSCTKCNKSTTSQQGSVAITSAMTKCVLCQNGSYSADVTKKCEACPKGHYCPLGKLIPCSPGTVQGSTGQTSCVNCLGSNSNRTGTYAANTGMSACIACGNGSYANTDKATKCETCALGHYCPAGKNIACPAGTAQGKYGQINCVNCVASSSSVSGTYAPREGMSACITCGNGSYASSAKQTSCQSCPKGYACPGGKKTICSIGTISAGGAASCNQCTGTTTSKAGSSICTSCASGCSSCYESGTNCTSCYGGYYKNGSSCPKCSAGKYCVGGTNGQQNCPVGTISSAGSTSCTSCGNGKTSVSNSCVSCAAGCINCSGSTTNCSNCTSGYYIKNNKCTSCPQRAYCPGGTAQPKYCSSYHEKCNTCNATTCTKCDEGYEVDEVSKGCKLSFDCEEEGGKKIADYCIITTKQVCNANVGLTQVQLESKYCKSGWRMPNDTEMCKIYLDPSNEVWESGRHGFNIIPRRTNLIRPGGPRAYTVVTERCITPQYYSASNNRTECHISTSSTGKNLFSPIDGCALLPVNATRNCMNVYTPTVCVRKID